MKHFIVLVFLTFCSTSFSQTTHRYETWLSAGVKGKVVKRLKWSASLNARFNEEGARSMFPEAGLEYKVKSWFRPGFDYRLVFEHQDEGGYKSGSSFRLNLNFRHLYKKRLKFGARVRYQYSTPHDLSPEFDEGLNHLFRLKPFVSYDIKGFFLTPSFATEFFFNPVERIYTPGLTKIRYSVGLELDVDSPHSVKLQYRADQRMTSYPELRVKHIVQLSYTYQL